MFGNPTITREFNGFVNRLNAGLNAGTEAVKNTTNAASNAISNIGSNIVKTANTAVNAMNGIPSTITSGNSAVTSTINSYFNSFGNNTNRGVNNTNRGLNNTNRGSNTLNIGPTSTLFVSKETPAWAYPLLVFIILVCIFSGIFYVYNDELGKSYTNIVARIKKGMGYDVPPPPQPNLDMTENVGIIEKVLPVSNKEVFNVSSNDYTYYDAEPLCRALGAELATYDQVKTAWENGADWCNYGWVKGQVAVYPTQRESWEKLQGGPDEEKEACGIPGINGGFFDNPEMKFGVTCYGDKPAQSANDERILMQNGVIPRTTEMLKVDERVQDFKNELGTIGLLPFNHKNWQET